MKVTRRSANFTYGNLTINGGQILAANGAVGAPSYAFSSDPDTGIFRSGANILDVSVGGVAGMRFSQAGLALHVDVPLLWGSSGLDTPDLYVYRDAANTLAQRNGTTAQVLRCYETYTDASNYGRAFLSMSSAGLILGTEAAGTGTQRGILGVRTELNGQTLGIRTLTELTTIAAAATTDTTILIPANALVLAVSVRVTTLIPTAATFDVGVAGATTRYGTGIAVAATTTNPGTNDGVRFYSGAAAIRITPNLTPADTTGRLRVTIHYLSVTAATS